MNIPLSENFSMVMEQNFCIEFANEFDDLILMGVFRFKVIDAMQQGLENFMMHCLEHRNGQPQNKSF